MQKFERSYLPQDAFDYRKLMDKFNVSLAEAEKLVAQNYDTVMWLNDTYQVAQRKVEPRNWPPLIHLSVKRIDKEPIHDWRELQQIKNMLVGPANEGVEIYPDEARLVDSANQYHLWVFSDPSIKLPFGFGERLTRTPEEAEAVGAKQR